MTRIIFVSGTLLLCLGLAAAPALACERHQQVHAPAPELAATAPLSAPDPAPAAATIVVTPAAAVVAPQSMPVAGYGRNCRQNRTTQALTQ